jgi:hypothetical protein
MNYITNTASDVYVLGLVMMRSRNYSWPFKGIHNLSEFSLKLPK